MMRYPFEKHKILFGHRTHNRLLLLACRGLEPVGATNVVHDWCVTEKHSRCVSNYAYLCRNGASTIEPRACFALRIWYDRIDVDATPFKLTTASSFYRHVF